MRFPSLPIPERVSFSQIKFANEMKGGRGGSNEDEVFCAGRHSGRVRRSEHGLEHRRRLHKRFTAVFSEPVTDPSGAAVAGAKVTSLPPPRALRRSDHQRRRQLQRHPPYP